MRPLSLIRQTIDKRDTKESPRRLVVREQPKESIESIRQAAQKRSAVAKRDAEKRTEDDRLRKLKEKEEENNRQKHKTEKEEIDEKRRELARLSIDIEKKKKEAGAAGVDILSGANKEAKVLLAKAGTTFASAEQLKRRLSDQLEAVAKESTEIKEKETTLNTSYELLKLSRDTLLNDQQIIAQRQQSTAHDLDTAKSLLLNLAILAELAVERAKAIDTLADDRFTEVSDALDGIRRALKVLENQKKSLGYQKDNLDRQAKANEAQWEWIKEQRLQLEMAQKEVKGHG